MYIHLGQDTVVDSNEIIGIFDLDNSTISKRTRDYLKKCEKKGEIETVSYELPKAFVVCADINKQNNKVFITQLSSNTIQKRWEYLKNMTY